VHGESTYDDENYLRRVYVCACVRHVHNDILLVCARFFGKGEAGGAARVMEGAVIRWLELPPAC
jgi:hypothetical protein